jgi:hypothetical protein
MIRPQLVRIAFLLPVVVETFHAVPVTRRCHRSSLPRLRHGVADSDAGAAADTSTRHFLLSQARLYKCQKNKSLRRLKQPEEVPTAALEVWRWCANFVVPHNLCPWAAASVQATGAISIYLLGDTEEDDTPGGFPALMPTLSDVFLESVSGDTPEYDPHTAIAFVVDASSNQPWGDFATFHDFYEDLLDDYWDTSNDDPDHTAHQVMWAPFHPDWRFGGLDDDDPLHFEKQSPYPTISIVSQAVIDQAGPQATQRIVESNQATLQQHNRSTWKHIYDQAVVRGAQSI